MHHFEVNIVNKTNHESQLVSAQEKVEVRGKLEEKENINKSF